MGEISSINIKPIKGNSESHNLRNTELDYVQKEYTYLNQSVVFEKVSAALERLKVLYKEKTGQKMQAKATPLREGVINLGEKTTFNQVKLMCKNIEDKFNIKTIQIHFHEDEGHIDKKTKAWKKNRHAHIVFNWIDENTGKSIKLNKQDMAQMQTLVAESLGLQRGQSSDKKHLTSMEFKRSKISEDVQELTEELNELRNENQQLKDELEFNRQQVNGLYERLELLNSKKISLKEEIKNEALNKRKELDDLINKMKLSKEKEINSLKNKAVQYEEVIKSKSNQIESLNEQIKTLEQYKSGLFSNKSAKLGLEVENLKEELKKTKTDLERSGNYNLELRENIKTKEKEIENLNKTINNEKYVIQPKIAEIISKKASELLEKSVEWKYNRTSNKIEFKDLTMKIDQDKKESQNFKRKLP